MGKYYHHERNKDSYLYVRLLDKDGNVVHERGAMGCHGGLIYTMDTRTATINVYRKKNALPYNATEVKRWISDLNAMGFPCEVKYDEDKVSDEEKQINWSKETVKSDLTDLALSVIRHGNPGPADELEFYNFFVHLKDFTNKSHMFSTLQLMRVLYETTLCRIPEMYFERIDANPTIDKFQLLQDCHKGSINGYSHAITYSGNGKNVGHDVLMKRFQVKEDLFKDPLAIYKSWNGDA